jgi:hypothetical protein
VSTTQRKSLFHQPCHYLPLEDLNPSPRLIIVVPRRQIDLLDDELAVVTAAIRGVIEGVRFVLRGSINTRRVRSHSCIVYHQRV